MSGQRCTWIAPSRKCCTRSAMYSPLRSDRPQARTSPLFLASTLCGVTAPAQRQTLSQTLCAALTEICWPTMARAIVGQQISVKAAQSVWDKDCLCAGAVTPQSVLARKRGEVRACGLSERKGEYIADLVQ